MSEEDLTLRLLREMRASIDKLSNTVDQLSESVDKRFDAVDKRFDAIDAHLGRVDVEARSLKAAVSKNTVLLEATMELVAQLKAGRTVTDVSIRHHEEP